MNPTLYEYIHMYRDDRARAAPGRAVAEDHARRTRAVRAPFLLRATNLLRAPEGGRRMGF